MLGIKLGINTNTPISVNWTPAQLSSLFWFDASDATTITDSGGLVTQWDDLSGNDRHLTQGTAADQPSTGINTLNSKNVIKFDGDYMGMASGVTTKAFIWVANNYNGSNLATNVTPVIRDTVNNFYIYHLVNVTDITYDIRLSGLAGNTGNTNVNGGSLVFGGSVNLGRTDAQNRGANIWYADLTVAPNFIDIGRMIASGQDYKLKGDIGEFIAFSSVPSESDRQKLEGYLAHKWGLTGELPAGHPYKDDVPKA